MPRQHREIPLYFILAPTHHGAALLSRRLNQHPAILSLGTGNPHAEGDDSCSCGAETQDCPFWSEIREAVPITMGEESPFVRLFPESPFISTRESVNRLSGAALALAADKITPLSWRLAYEPAARFNAIYAAFFSRARELAPHRVYVDAEMSVMKFMTLKSMGFNVRGVIHMVRDPRACAADMQQEDPSCSAAQAAASWAAGHNRIRKMRTLFRSVPFLTVRYEDLAEKPAETLQNVTGFLRLKENMPESLTIPPEKNHLTGLSSRDAAMGFVPKSVENGENPLPPEALRAVLKAAGPLFSEFGYKAEN